MEGERVGVEGEGEGTDQKNWVTTPRQFCRSRSRSGCSRRRRNRVEGLGDHSYTILVPLELSDLGTPISVIPRHPFLLPKNKHSM